MIYKIIYFHTYKFFRRIGENATPRACAVLLMSFINMFHYGIALFILYYFIGEILVDSWPAWAILSIGFLIIFSNMVYVFYGKNYEKNEKLLEEAPVAVFKKRNKLVAFYYIASILLFITLIVLNYWMLPKY